MYQDPNQLNNDRSFIPALDEDTTNNVYNSMKDLKRDEDLTEDELRKYDDDDYTKYEDQENQDGSQVVDETNNETKEKRNVLDDARNEIFEYYSKIKNNKKKVSISSQDTKYKKVQVQEEETGVPRVQVNAGYENPKIQCEGSEMCSGVLLKWVLTFYGSSVSQNSGLFR